MKISIQVLGSLGDVMPYISTALVLQDKGVDVSILGPRDFSPLIAEHGIKVAEPAKFSLDAWMQQAAKRGTLNGPVAFFRDWGDMIQPHINDVMGQCLKAAEGADIIVANLICAPARVAAEAHHIPLVMSGQQPVLSPTRDQPCAMMWRPWHGERLNRTSYAMINLANRVIGHTLKQHRKSLGLHNRPRFSDMRTHLGSPLPKISTIPWPIIQERPSDWGADDYLTAYPSRMPSASNSLSGGLRKFLDAGSSPVYIGLGSLSAAHGESILDAAIIGLEQLGCRGLIAKSMLDAPLQLSDQFHIIDHEPHDQLFQHCAAVVHHGGAGTSDTALRAGIPQVLQPHFLDQFWFANRLRRLGVAPPALRVKNLQSEHITDTLRSALSPTCCDRAKTIQAEAITHDGASDLATLIVSQLDHFGVTS